MGVSLARLTTIMADARLHDLRHTHASHAVMNGEILHVVGRLLGHRHASTTDRCIPLDDTSLSQAAEWTTAALQSKLGSSQKSSHVTMRAG